MNRFLAACISLFIGLAFAAPLPGQDSFAGIDLLYPEFAHPREDALAAIKQRDFRFIATDHRNTVPGVEAYPRLREVYGTKFIKQRFRIFATRSQNFSFGLRARAYAFDYNQTLLVYLRDRRKSDADRER
ncbi:MAG: hypothetical protein ABIR29_02475 [Chthoniobacterales bacterium]